MKLFQVISGILVVCSVFSVSAAGGVIVTRNGNAQLGDITEADGKYMIKTEFGRVGIPSDQVVWASTSNEITTFYQAGKAAEAAGKDSVAMFLFRCSHRDEPATRARAIEAAKAIQQRHAPLSASNTPSAPEAASPAARAPEPEQAENVIAKDVRHDLVQIRGKRVARVKAADVPDVDMYALYFSAHWCNPCRLFTPQLVNFYTEWKSEYSDKFEVIFISSDRSEDAMEEYMEEMNMPWPALEFSAIHKSVLSKYRGSGIPCLVLVDREGEVLAHSYEGTRYVGPLVVLNELKARLQRKPSEQESTDSPQATVQNDTW